MCVRVCVRACVCASHASVCVCVWCGRVRVCPQYQLAFAVCSLLAAMQTSFHDQQGIAMQPPSLRDSTPTAITSVFAVNMMQQLTCTQPRCAAVSVTLEKNMALSLTITNCSTLVSALENLTSAEFIETYKCQICQGDGGTKRYILETLPPVFVLQVRGVSWLCIIRCAHLCV